MTNIISDQDDQSMLLAAGEFFSHGGGDQPTEPAGKARRGRRAPKPTVEGSDKKASTMNTESSPSDLEDDVSPSPEAEPPAVAMGRPRSRRMLSAGAIVTAAGAAGVGVMIPALVSHADAITFGEAGGFALLGAVGAALIQRGRATRSDAPATISEAEPDNTTMTPLGRRVRNRAEFGTAEVVAPPPMSSSSGHPFPFAPPLPPPPLGATAHLSPLPVLVPDDLSALDTDAPYLAIEAIALEMVPSVAEPADEEPVVVDAVEVEVETAEAEDVEVEAVEVEAVEVEAVEVEAVEVEAVEVEAVEVEAVEVEAVEVEAVEVEAVEVEAVEVEAVEDEAVEAVDEGVVIEAAILSPLLPEPVVIEEMGAATADVGRLRAETLLVPDSGRALASLSTVLHDTGNHVLDEYRRWVLEQALGDSEFHTLDIDANHRDLFMLSSCGVATLLAWLHEQHRATYTVDTWIDEILPSQGIEIDDRELAIELMIAAALYAGGIHTAPTVRLREYRSDELVTAMATMHVGLLRLYCGIGQRHPAIIVGQQFDGTPFAN